MMRRILTLLFVVLISLAALACASSDGFSQVIDASEGGVPFAFVGAGFTSQVRPGLFPDGRLQQMTETLLFVFTNVTDRPQTIEALNVKPRSTGTSRVQIEPTGLRVNRMIEPGDDVELEVLVQVSYGPPRPGERIDTGLHLDAMLRLADQVTYRYPISIPVKVDIPVNVP